MAKTKKRIVAVAKSDNYGTLVGDISVLLHEARRVSARSVNAVLTATYWLIGRRMVEFEQRGEKRAEYGGQLLEKLARDLSQRFGRGFSIDNLETMRLFYLAYPVAAVADRFPLSWSHYVMLVRRVDSLPVNTGCVRMRTRPLESFSARNEISQ